MPHIRWTRLAVLLLVLALFLLVARLFIGAPAHAQTAQVVAVCATPPAVLPAGQVAPVTQNPNGQGCTQNGGVFNTTSPTLTNGQTGNMQLGAAGSLKVELWSPNSANTSIGGSTNTSDAISSGTTGLNSNSFGRVFNGATWDRLYSAAGALAAATNGTGVQAVSEAGRSFNNITTATTTTVKSGAGYLHTLNINTCVASATVTVFDSTTGSGSKIGTLTCPVTVGNPISQIFDVKFATGLTIVTSAATDLTVSYW